MSIPSRALPARKRSPRWTGWLAGLLAVSCATPPPAPPPFVRANDEVEEKVLSLEAEVKDLRRELERMTARLEAGTTQRDASQENVKNSPRTPKSTSEDVEEDSTSGFDSTPLAETIREAEATDTEEPAVLADSRHEAMHRYFRGLDHLKNGDYDEAVKSLRAFLEEAPDHVYGDRAQYLITQSYFHHGEYALAIVASNLLESRYPTSLKVPEGMYHRGLAYLELGQRKQGEETFRQLLDRFPRSPVSEKASRKLAELSVKGSSGNVPIFGHPEG